MRINGNLFLGTDYTDYMDFLIRSLVYVILSEAKNLPHALGDARTGRCFTTFSMTKEIRDKIRVIRA